MRLVLSVLGSVLLKLLWGILGLLGLAVLLVCLVLFVPVRYRAVLESKETLLVQGRLSWFCSLLSVTVSYQDGKLDRRLCIAGVDLLRHFGKRKEKKAQKKAKNKNAKKKQKETERKPKEERKAAEHREAERKEAGTKESGKKTVFEETKDDSSGEAQSSEELSKIRRLLQGIAEGFSGLRQKGRRMLRSLRQKKEKFISIKERLLRIKELWQTENTQRMVCIIKANVLHLWKQLKPKKIKGSIRFGTGDPALTGQVFGAVACFYAVYGNELTVTPDFESACFQGKLLLKGRISVITVLLALQRVFFSNEWKQLRREMEQI